MLNIRTIPGRGGDLCSHKKSWAYKKKSSQNTLPANN